MKTTIKKTACAALAGALIFSVTGCSIGNTVLGKIGGDKEEENYAKEVAKTAEDYCDAVKELDVDKLVDLSADDLEDKKDEMEEALDFDGGLYSEDMGAVLDAIADTITYEIDEDSVEADEDEGSVDVKFTLFDYKNNEFGDDVDSADAAADAIENGQTCEIELTVELENTEDGWKVKGTEDITSAVYEFLVMGTLDPDFTFVCDLDAQAAIDLVYASCDAAIAIDYGTFAGFCGDYADPDLLERYGETPDFSDRSLYSEDLDRVLTYCRDRAYYEIDEESLTIDQETGTATIVVTMYVSPLMSVEDDDEELEFQTPDEVFEYLDSQDDIPCEITLELEMTEDGWVLVNGNQMFGIANYYMMLAYYGTDFEFGSASNAEPDADPVQYAEGEMPLYYYDGPASVAGEYSVIEYSTEYFVRIDYPDHYLKFMTGYVSNMDQWDGQTHEGHVNGAATDYWNVSVACFTDCNDLVDLTGYTFIIDHDGEVTEVDVTTLGSTGNLELNFYRDDAQPDAWSGNYTITLIDPWGRTLWEGYVEVA